jgi:subtilisin-like proprotein convertase family protein
VVAGFSSRGPSAFESNKPDIIGPGVSILAAFAGDPTEFGSISGTSMSSPHNAGSAALLRALFPGWTPQEIKSALMLTSKNTGLTKEDGVTPADPFDVGAGRMDLNFAAKTGLVMHETTLKFFQADPTAGGDPKTLNIASVKSDQCVGTCSWTRRFRSVAADPVTYDATMDLPAGVTGSVTPANFTVNPGQTVTLTIEVDVSGATPETWNFGEVVLTPQGAGATPGSDTFTTAAAPVAIPDNQYPPGGAFNAPTMACQTVDASSLPPSATITDVSIQAAMAHTWVGDTVAKLGSPDGTVMGVFSRPGMAEASDGAETGFGDSSNLLATSPITFEDSGGAGDAENMGNGGTLGDAGVVCQDDARCNFFANRGGIAVGPTNFAGFDGEAASGIWTFCMGDGAGGDTGTLTSWTLNIDYETSAPSIYSTLHLPVVAFGVADEPDVMLPQGSLAIPTDAATTSDADLTIANVGFSDLDWTLDEELAPAAAFGTTTLSQSTSETLAAGSVSCNTGGLHADNSYWRAFALNDFGITGSFDVSSVRVGVEQATSTNPDQPVTVNLYTLNGAFVIANLTPIGTATANVTPQALTLIDVPVTGTVPASGTLVVEVFTPDGQTDGNGFFIGSNAAGQSAPSFIIDRLRRAELARLKRNEIVAPFFFPDSVVFHRAPRSGRARRAELARLKRHASVPRLRLHDGAAEQAPILIQ